MCPGSTRSTAKNRQNFWLAKVTCQLQARGFVSTFSGVQSFWWQKFWLAKVKHEPQSGDFVSTFSGVQSFWRQKFRLAKVKHEPQSGDFVSTFSGVQSFWRQKFWLAEVKHEPQVNAFVLKFSGVLHCWSILFLLYSLCLNFCSSHPPPVPSFPTALPSGLSSLSFSQNYRLSGQILELTFSLYFHCATFPLHVFFAVR